MLDATMLFYEKDRLPQPVIREKKTAQKQPTMVGLKRAINTG